MATREKSRIYRLANGKTPPTWQLQSQDSRAKQLIQYDKDKGENRALRYCENQKSFYVDEQDEHARLTSILFRDGTLVVEPKNKLLMDFLEIHPGNKSNGGTKFYEQDFAAEAVNDMILMDLEDQARDLARELSIDEGVRVLIELGEKRVDERTSEEIQRDLRVHARRDPERFIEVAGLPTSTDSAIANLFYQAVELGVLNVREHQDRDEVFKNYKGVEGGKKMLIRFNAGEDAMAKLETYLKSKDGKDEFIELEKQVKAKM
jgi:hypothetical protein